MVAAITIFYKINLIAGDYGFFFQCGGINYYRFYSLSNIKNGIWFNSKI